MAEDEIKNRLKRIFHGVHTHEEKDSIRFIESIDLDKNWEKLKNKVHSPGYSPRRKKMTITLSIAAAIVILIASSVFIYTLESGKSANIRQVRSFNENTSLILNDASKIVLKKGSILSYPENFEGRRREVKLSGEAWFEISKDTKQAFYVLLENTTVEVLGTSFNIKEESNGRIIVSVVSGSVLFYSNENKKHRVILEKGQQGLFDNNTGNFEKTSFEGENFLYWKTRKLVFKNKSLEEVFNVLEQNYNYSFIVEDKLVLNNKWTTTCEGQTLEDIMSELSALFGIGYTMRNDTVFVYMDTEE